MFNTPSSGSFDLVVVGAGIVGLAHALAAARMGKRVVVIDRDAQANGASIRNFGFVAVTGQQAGDCWRRAMHTRHRWAEIAPLAGIRVEHAGLCMAVRRETSMAVLEAFAATDMGRDCEVLTARQASLRMPLLRAEGLVGALWSPHELRVESRDAVPRLAAWLEHAYGVVFHRNCVVQEVAPPRVVTSSGTLHAEAVVVCPGDDFKSLFAERIAAYGLTRCKLHMMRLALPSGGPALGAAVMSDLSLLRYQGYAELPAAQALRTQLQAEKAPALDNGVHLIVVQSADGSLVVGDSHHYGATPDPFAPTAVDDLILDEFDAVFQVPARRVVERWIGTYASATDRLMFIDRPGDAVRIVVVTSGTGASTAFAIGDEVIAELFGAPSNKLA